MGPSGGVQHEPGNSYELMCTECIEQGTQRSYLVCVDPSHSVISGEEYILRAVMHIEATKWCPEL